MPVSAASEPGLLARDAKPTIRAGIRKHPLDQSARLRLGVPHLTQASPSCLEGIGQRVAKGLELLGPHQSGLSSRNPRETEIDRMSLDPELAEGAFEAPDLAAKIRSRGTLRLP